MTLGERIRDAWNALLNKDPPRYPDVGAAFATRPDRPRFTCGNERTFLSAVYTRIGIDCAQIDIRHVKLDDNQRYLKTIDSDLNRCFSSSANMDQTGRNFVEDAVISLMDEGCIAIVPIDFEDVLGEIRDREYKDISSLRVGKIVQWHPAHVDVEVYNEADGLKHQLTIAKDKVAIIENPLYAVMNEPNSTIQRLKRKLALLDSVDEQSSSGKLDLIIQLPYVIKSDARRAEANRRRAELQEQLAGSKYGIAYTDGTERIVQLNRSLENNLMAQIEYLTNTAYGQLGITSTVMDGTADEKTMLNYSNRTIKPLMNALVEECTRKFLSTRAKSRHEAITYFDNPFALVPVASIATMADTFTRNEIMTSNEIRQILGMKPSADPKADELKNKNLSEPAGAVSNQPNATLTPTTDETEEVPQEENQNGEEISV